MADNLPQMTGEENARRDFLKSCGRFAVTVPPAMTVLLSTSLSSPAIARSYGGGGMPAKRIRPKRVRLRKGPRFGPRGRRGSRGNPPA